MIPRVSQEKDKRQQQESVENRTKKDLTKWRKVL
jgi:hypothetical protein